MLEGTPNPARWTRRVLLLLAALALAWGAAFRVRALLALGAAESATLLLLALYPRLAARGVGVLRRMPSRAFEEEEVSVVFGLENRGRLPFVLAEVEDCFAPDQELYRRAPLPALVRGRERAVGSYRASCFGKRGAYAIGPARVRLADPLGLFLRDVTLEEPTPFVVYPRAVDLPLATPADRRTWTSDEVLTVREYRPGDSLRRIHWPTAARRGKLAVLELEPERARDVTLFIDLDRRTLRGLGRRSTLEHSVRIAASAAASYVRRGDRVGLIAQGAQPVLVPQGGGERHLALVLDELARVKPDGEEAIESLVARSAAELRPGSTAFVVLAAADDQHDARGAAPTGPPRSPLRPREQEQALTRERTAAIAALRARRCDVVCVLLDEPTFLPIYREQQRGPEHRLSVPRVADALVREGALVYVVAQGDDLAERFLHPFARGTRHG